MSRLLRMYERHKDGRRPWAGRAEAKTLALALDTFRSMLRATARRHDVDEGHIRFGLMDGSSDAPVCPRPDPRQPRRRRTPEPDLRPAGFASIFKERDMSEGDAGEDLGNLEAPYEAPQMRGARDGRAEGREPQGDAKRGDPHKFPFSEWDMGGLGDDEGIPGMPGA